MQQVSQPMSPAEVALDFPAARNWFVGSPLFDVFWIAILFCLTRVTVLPDLNSIASAAADLFTIAVFAKSPRTYLELLSRNKLIMSWPALAVLSSVWSVEPSLTFYHSIQFALSSVAALALYANAGLFRLIRIIFYFNLLAQLLSLALMLSGSAFVFDLNGNMTGAYQHKNELGMFCTLQIICALTLLATGWRPLISLAGMGLALFLLSKSGSGTSFILTALLVGLFPAFLIIRRGMTSVVVSAGLGIALMAAAALVIVSLGADPVDTILNALGKDRGLTGRDEIWAVGLQTISQYPLLGVGFLAYWKSYATSAAYLQYLIETDIIAFHNVYIEVTVALGYVGLALFVAGLLNLLWRSLRFLALTRTALSMMPLMFLIWIMILCTTENPIFWNSQLHLLLVALSAAAAPQLASERFSTRSFGLRDYR